MADNLCDLCHSRPAMIKVRVSQNGHEQTLNLCESDYKRLHAQARRSPFESLFGSNLFSDFFADSDNDIFQKGRFSSRLDDLDNRIGSDSSQRLPKQKRATTDLLDYFSDQSKEILQQAAQRAVQTGKREVDTEDLLYTLADNEVVQTILKQFKISDKDLKTYIEANSPANPQPEDPSSAQREVGISPRVKSALQLALSAAQELGHNYVGPEHLMIGLAEEDDGLAGQILRKYGLTTQALRQQTIKVVGKGAQEGKVHEPSNTPQLDKFSRDLTELARKGKLDPVIGRAQEIETMIEILARRKKNNPVLIGEPGVGKTAVVEGLAQRIAAGDVPEVLRNKRLLELNINSMVAGSKYRGEFEERVKNILEEIVGHSDQLVIFIDELHTIMSAGQNDEGGLNLANVFKPALARGELHLIGATTLNEYQKHIERDAATERRFQPLVLAEPSVEQTVLILRGLRDSFEAHHKVTITDEAMVAAASLSDRYITNRFLPDKAIDLIDQASARVRIGANSRPAAVQELENQIKQLNRELEYAKSRKQFDRCKQIEEETMHKEAQAETALQKWKNRVGTRSQEVRVEDVAEIVSRLTGIPVRQLTAEERDRLLHMEEHIHQRVIGQNEAIDAVCDAVRLSRAGIREGRKPVATFLFLGPTGVGKTELAKALADIVYGNEDALVRIDMTEYGEKHTVARLIGAPPGYVGYEEGGQLTERVRRQPHTVVLFDEIEKANPEVLNLLLQLFDDGRLTDGKGRLVDFTNTIVICTSNVGAELIRDNLHLGKPYDELKTQLMGLLHHYFKPEFLNRIDEIIVFHALTQEQIGEITKLQLESLRRLAHGQGIELTFDPSLIDYLVDVCFVPEYGARELKRKIRTQVSTRLAHSMLNQEITDGDKVTIRYDSEIGHVVIDNTGGERTGENLQLSGKDKNESTT